MGKILPPGDPKANKKGPQEGVRAVLGPCRLESAASWQAGIDSRLSIARIEWSISCIVHVQLRAAGFPRRYSHLETASPGRGGFAEAEARQGPISGDKIDGHAGDPEV